MPISGIRTDEKKVIVRIKIDESSQKRYNRFRHDIEVAFDNPEIKGYGGFTDIRKSDSDLDLNVCYGKEYIHIIIYGKKQTRNRIIEILNRHFVYMNTKEDNEQ